MHTEHKWHTYIMVHNSWLVWLWFVIVLCLDNRSCSNQESETYTNVLVPNINHHKPLSRDLNGNWKTMKIFNMPRHWDITSTAGSIKSHHKARHCTCSLLHGFLETHEKQSQRRSQRLPSPLQRQILLMPLMSCHKSATCVCLSSVCVWHAYYACMWIACVWSSVCVQHAYVCELHLPCMSRMYAAYVLHGDNMPWLCSHGEVWYFIISV